MTSDSADLLDSELLDLAEATLHDNGYVVERTSVEATEVLLAEDRDSVVILAALLSSEGVLQLEPPMTNLLAARFEGMSATPKRWDGYVTIITSGKARADLGEPLYALTYNLARVRRIVRVNVDPTRADVQRALAPLLPLSADRDILPAQNALQTLAQRLVADGVPESDVSRAMAEFRAQQSELEGQVADVDDPATVNGHREIGSDDD